MNIKKGDVWWVAFDASIGGEIRKTRPAIVVSNTAANFALNRVVVVPLTSTATKVYPSEAIVTVLGRRSKAMADQITTASKQRLRQWVAGLTAAELRAVEDAILRHLAIQRV